MKSTARLKLFFLPILFQAACDDGLENSEPVELFPKNRVIHVDLELPEKSENNLRLSINGYQYAKMSIDENTPLEVGIRIKGHGSRRPYDDKPSFRIKLNFASSNQKINGRKSLIFNNMFQDGRNLTECFGYKIFRVHGIASPECSYAFLTINGKDKGLYTHIEAIDEVFSKKHFGKGALFEANESHSDFGGGPGHHRDYLSKSKKDENHRKIIDLIGDEIEDDSSSYNSMKALYENNPIRLYMALEILTGREDGYTSNGNNHYVYVGDDYSIQMIPSGLDSSLVSSGLPIHGQTRERRPNFSRRGNLMNYCLRFPECIDPYHDLLRTIVEGLDYEELFGYFDTNRKIIAPYFARDPIYKSDNGIIGQEQDKLRGFLPIRVEFILSKLDEG
jgi:spore coat protein CotH